MEENQTTEEFGDLCHLISSTALLFSEKWEWRVVLELLVYTAYKITKASCIRLYFLKL